MIYERILVVDDDERNRKLAEAILAAAGYAVLLAENGALAVSAFEEHRPDLVLLDILMPGMDGFETCERLRGSPGGQDTPILFLTALGDFATHEKALQSGAEDFLTKPFKRTELLIRVRSLLQLRRLRTELLQSNTLIRSQRDALLRAQEQKEELTALIVHDLKNPLANILVNSQYVLREAQLGDDERDALGDIVTGADAMHRMVMDLLDISRSEDGTLVPKLEDVDLPALLDEVVSATRRRAEGRGHALVVAAEVGRGTIQGDRDLVRRLVENLLDNCLKYTPSGGTIRIEARSVNAGLMELRVRDEGPGIPEAYREKIFEKYVCLDSGASRHARTSRGLGLAFCRLAAEAHGGRIWAEPNEPKGTAFCVHLPTGQGR